MYIINKNQENKTIDVAIPLTNGTGKTRIKERSILNEYGIPVATKQKPFSQKCYIEWQIGYDVKIKDEEKAKLTTIKDLTFTGASGETKYLYELSEYIKYFYDWGVITKEELLSIKNYLHSLHQDKYLDVHEDMLIKRSHLIEKEINGMNYMYAKIEYPLLIYKFDKYEIITEIVVREKQYAVGTQPMLYFCFPITELKDSGKLLGRVAKAKEEAVFSFNESKKDVLLEMLKIFGTLTANHNKDVISIIDVIIKR